MKQPKSQQNITKIYLVTNCYGDPNKVYVGKTKGQRISSHKHTFGKQIEYNYIDEINSLRKEDYIPLECYWIEQFRQWGFEVVNKNKGGGGCSFLTQKTKNKISKSLKGKPKPKGWGKTNSNNKERSLKISKSMSGRIQSEEEKQNRRHPKPEGFGEKIRKYQLGKPKSEETKKKLKFKSQEGINNIKKANNKPIIQYNLDMNPIKEWPSISEAQKWLNKGYITGCLLGRQKQAGGFIWKFKNQSI